MLEGKLPTGTYKTKKIQIYLDEVAQPRSQGLSSSRPRKRERGDPGWGWSRVSYRKIRPREGSFASKAFVKIYCPLQKEASALLRAAHAKLIQLAMFFSSLHFASYCNINYKAKQVRCLEALHFGKDVVAVVTKRIREDNDQFHLLHSQCYGISSRGFKRGFVLECADERSDRDDTWREKKKKHGGAGAFIF